MNFQIRIFSSAAVLGWLLLLALVSTAWGLTRQDVLDPLKDDLDQAKTAEQELVRQAELYAKEQQAKLDALQSALGFLDKAAQRLQQEHAARNQALDRAVLTGWQLITNLEDKVNVPGHGFVTMDELRTHREGQRREMQEQWTLVEAGDYEVLVPGLGLTTRNDLLERGRELETETAAFTERLQQGRFVIHFPGLGEVDGVRLQAHRQLLEERITQTTALIDAGDYPVVLPHLGAVTKNGLKARIAARKQELEGLRQRFKDGEERILRARMGWSTGKEVQVGGEHLEQEKKDLQQQLKEKRMEFLLPTGFTDAASLERRLADLKADMARVEQELVNKTYAVALPDGTWANLAELDKALLNAIIAPEIRQGLQQGRKNIAVTGRLELELLQLEADKTAAWLKDFPGFAEPHFALLTRQQLWQQTMLKEFRQEQDLAQRRIQKELTWLERCLRLLP